MDKKIGQNMSEKCIFVCNALFLFCPGDLVTRSGEREIRPVSSRLPGNPGELV